MKKPALLFDLDGTLLDTLSDLCISTNFALLQNGFPARTEDEVRRFVGNGVEKLICRALPEGSGQAEFDRVFPIFLSHYEAHMEDHTAPYPGIPALLCTLSEEGYPLAVVSNKFDAGVKALVTRFFAPHISVAIGISASVRAKPAPDAPLAALRALRESARNAYYIGDSETDLLTAQAAEISAIGVTWGFRTRAFLENCGAKLLVDTPQELYSILQPEK